MPHFTRAPKPPKGASRPVPKSPLRIYKKHGKGNKLTVILPIKEYDWILEDLEDIRLYDKAKQKFVDADQAFIEIEEGNGDV